MINKRYLILGASSDIAIELIKQLNFTENDIVVAHYNSSISKIKAVQASVKCKIVPIQADFSDEMATDVFIKQVEAKLETPTHIVHLPSVPIDNKRFKELSWKDYQLYLDVQLRSIVKVLNLFLPRMAKVKAGNILFMLTSCTCNVPPKFLSHYVTSKYALMGFMKSIATEYAGKGININAVSPSMIETSFLSNINEKVIEGTALGNPMKRNAEVRDIVPLMIYFLSDDAKYVTGVNIPVTGGECF